MWLLYTSTTYGGPEQSVILRMRDMISCRLTPPLKLSYCIYVSYTASAISLLRRLPKSILLRSLKSWSLSSAMLYILFATRATPFHGWQCGSTAVPALYGKGNAAPIYNTWEQRTWEQRTPLHHSDEPSACTIIIFIQVLALFHRASAGINIKQRTCMRAAPTKHRATCTYVKEYNVKDGSEVICKSIQPILQASTVSKQASKQESCVSSTR